MSKQLVNNNVENETDDVFEEFVKHMIKTEKIQVQNGNFETLHQVSDENLDSDSSNLNAALRVNVSKGNSSSNVNKDVKNNVTENVEYLKHEDPDDVFDEEQEKGEKETIKHIGFENTGIEIKIEIDEDNDTISSQENLNFLAKAIKQENNPEGNFNDSLIKDEITKEAISVRDGEPHTKVDFVVETEGSRLEKNDLNKISSSHQMDKSGKAVGKQIGIEKSLAIKDGNIRNNIDNNSQSLQSNVEGRDKQPHIIIKNLISRVKHAMKKSQTQKDKANNDKIKSDEQNGKKEVSTSIIIQNTGSRERFEVENLNKATNNKRPSDGNNKQQEENGNNSCYPDNAKQTGMQNIPKGNKNISRKKRRRKCWNLKKKSTKIDLENDTNIKIANTGSFSHHIIDIDKKSKNGIKRKGLLNQNHNFNKQFVGKAKNQNHRKLSLQNTSANIYKSDKVQEDSDLAVTITGSEEDAIAENKSRIIGSKENIIAENKDKTQTEIGQIEASSSRTLPKICDKSVNKSYQTEIGAILEICAENAENTQIEKHKDLQNMHVDYMCKKCSFKAKRKAVMKRHLLKHGIEFSSTVTSFFDVIKKAKLYTSQLEQIYVEKEPQTKVIRNNQCENEINTQETNTNVNNDVRFEKEEPVNALNNALQVQNVEICTNIPPRRNTSSSSYTLPNKKGDEVLNAEDKTLSQSEETVVIISKDKIVEKPTYINQTIENKNVPMEKSCSSESEQSVEDGEVGKVASKNNPSINIEYSCRKCQFKTKRRALLKVHLVTHREELASGIITFLDLVKNDKVSPDQFKKDSPHKEVQTESIDENIEADDKVDILDDAFQNIVVSDAQSKCENNLENEECCKTVENGNGSIDNVVRDNTTEGSVINEAREEGTLLLNKNTTATNVDNKSKIMENKVNENECMEVPSTNIAKPKSVTKRKRRAVRTSLPTKKIKLQVDGKTMYCCDECSYQSTWKKNLNEHKIVHSKEIVKCNQCQFITHHKRNLANHMLIHLKPDEIKLYKCSQCPYQTKRNSDLRIHMVMHKKPEEVKMFQCDKCPYRSIRKGNLRSHQLCHKSGDEVTFYNCAKCSFKTRGKSSLRNHMWRHQNPEEISRVKCEQCTFTTIYKSSLRKHSLVHKSRSEIKTYDCPSCPYRGKHKSHLVAHMLLHKDPSEVKMHECVHCSYKSVRRTNLLAHMLEHKSKEEIKMAKCEHCSYETKLRGNLRKHVKRRHLA